MTTPITSAEAALLAELRAVREERDRLRDVLEGVVKIHVTLVECGDCGFWDAEKEPEIIAARAALAACRTEGTEGEKPSD